jgi:hypothetical protein
MPFPFSIKYSATLNGEIHPESYPELLQYISDFIVNKPAKNIIIENNWLSFKAGSTGSNWNIMATIDRGKFELDERLGHAVLTYEFFMYKLFIFAGILAIAAGALSQTILVGVGVFSWLCGMNWVIALLRHRAMLDELAAEIDNFIQQKESKP